MLCDNVDGWDGVGGGWDGVGGGWEGQEGRDI